MKTHKRTFVAKQKLMSIFNENILVKNKNETPTLAVPCPLHVAESFRVL